MLGRRIDQYRGLDNGRPDCLYNVKQPDWIAGQVVRKLSRVPKLSAVVRDERSEAGDSLVEVLLALLVIGLTAAAILGAFATAISATSEHRTLSTGDTVLKSFLETATNEIQFQQSAAFVSCAVQSPYPTGPYDQSIVQPFNAGTIATQNGYSVSIIGIQWEGSGCPGNPLHPPPELITARATSQGESDVLSFVVAAPDVPGAGFISSISPESGISTGGTAVTITLQNGAFTTPPALTVSFGGVPATNVKLVSSPGVSPAQITADSPAGTDPVDVSVTDSLGTTGFSAADRFTYWPWVTGLSPSQGGTTSQVSIAGTGFTNVSGVTFGGVPAASFTFNDSKSITAVPPAGSGKVDVQVTTPAGTSPINQPNDQFTYGLSVVSLNPSSGPDLGGTPVTIIGTSFDPTQPATVTFGGVPATNVTVVDPQHITAISPSGTQLQVDVRVTQAGSTSPINQPGDQFSYSPGPVVGLGIVLNAGVSSGTPVLTCGPAGATDSCTITGVGKGGSANYFVEFVDSQGIPNVFSPSTDSTIGVSGKGATPISVLIPQNTSRSSTPVNSNINNKSSSTSLTFSTTSTTYTLTVTISP
jgi:hypothetical protein